MCERVQFNIKLFGGIVMNKKKVKTLHSMMLKIVCLFSLGVILMSATLILISLPRSQDMTKTLVQNYMMSSVKSNGYIIDTLMAVNGKIFCRARIR